jgi:sirohydrochlorin ferrochelatase
MALRSLYRLAVVVILLAGSQVAAAGEPKTGFLVVAPDRGYAGNEEIRSVFDEFRKSYPAARAWVGRDYNGMGSEYSAYLSRALDELKQAGVTDIVAIPLFLSTSDPVAQKVITHLPAYHTGTIRWAAPMSESYLVGQILLDRVEAVSREPEQERLFVIGVGAMDEAGEAALKADLEKLISYVTPRKRFKEARAVVYYDRDAKGGQEKNKAADLLILQAAAKKGRTLPVLATFGPKYDRHMGLTVWFGEKFKELNVVYTGEELMPHPNFLLWLKKTANHYVPAGRAEIGVVIMPHGANQPWNDAVEQTLAPLRSQYPVEMAYGMADPDIIQQAVARLEQRGSRRIVFVRMYALGHHLKDRTDYILGLTPVPPGHDHDHGPPAQVRSAALFSSFGGYEEYPGITEILHQRIVEVSRDPSQETVILVAHGEKTDEGDAKWLSVINANIDRLREESHCATLKSIHAATVREDWPEQRDKAVAEIRKMIEDHAKQGRVLVIADRLYGAGPYKKLFHDLDYVLNEKGLLHPVITRWIADELERRMTALMSPMETMGYAASR